MKGSKGEVRIRGVEGQLRERLRKVSRGKRRIGEGR